MVGDDMGGARATSVTELPVWVMCVSHVNLCHDGLHVCACSRKKEAIRITRTWWHITTSSHFCSSIAPLHQQHTTTNNNNSATNNNNNNRTNNNLAATHQHFWCCELGQAVMDGVGPQNIQGQGGDRFIRVGAVTTLQASDLTPQPPTEQILYQRSLTLKGLIRSSTSVSTNTCQ